jgi:glycosyltransferase involved in cell wall biosynthesis
VKLLFVVQRYGHEVAGGAERCCLEFATRLTARGHHVEVLTSRAKSYQDWADHYPEGATDIDGVVVHRLGVDRPREHERFGRVNARVLWTEHSAPIHLQHEWSRAQGPFLPELPEWLRVHGRDFDAVIFYTYLYWPTWKGLETVAGVVPTVLHPTAHDESPLYLTMFDDMFRRPTGLGFLTEEEGELVRRRFHVDQPAVVTGVGVDLDVRVPDAEVAAFRASVAGLGNRPYLAFLGRIDPIKGSEEMLAFFAAYKDRHPGDLALVVLGEPVKPPGAHPDVFVPGFVSEARKHAALAGSVALVQPSFFESFSIVLVEAWAHRKPALVQGRCAVLAGQARRSGGALPYVGFAEFEAGLERLLGDPELAAAMGGAGRRYAERRYHWDTVLDTYETFLAGLTAQGRA